jgi:hypothetical protein
MGSVPFAPSRVAVLGSAREAGNVRIPGETSLGGSGCRPAPR